MIRLSHVSKEYLLDSERFIALYDINLEIKEGEFAAIIGPSGSGKSTLMHMIGLLDRPSSGSIYIADQDTAKLSDNELSRLRNEFVGFVFQQFNLINKLTVLENVLLPVIYSRKKLITPRRHALELLTRFGIASKATSYPNKLSGGEQQRVAIARSLIMSPKLILADEPTGNLDTKTGETILELLTSLNQNDGMTVILVTHDSHIADKAQRKIRIVDGKIVKN